MGDKNGLQYHKS